MLKKILNTYQERNFLDKERANENNFILFNKILKTISFLPAKIFYFYKISSDTVTVLSFFSIIFSGLFFIAGHLPLGVSFMILFGILDAIDGDIARLEKKKNKKYGSTIDSFGADIFYLTIPFCVAFYIFFYEKEFSFIIDISFILIFGFLISSLIIFYRLISLRNYRVFLESKKIRLNKNKIKSKKKFKILNFFLKNEIIRGNFFSEPGLIMNLSILLYLNLFNYIYFYFIVVAVYHGFRTSYLFLGTLHVYIRS